MFFMRLRRGAKWAFILLIFVFAFSFLFAGVGSGGSGGDVIQQLLGMRGGSDPIKSAEKDAAKYPKRASVWAALATAYTAKERRVAAIKAYEKYLTLKPKDTTVLAQLGSLQEEVTSLRWDRYATLQSEMVSVSGPLTSDPLQTLAGTDSLLTAYKTSLSTKETNAYSSYATAAQAWEKTYKRFAQAVPETNAIRRSQVELQLAQAASSANDYPTAIKSYKNFLRLAPKSPLVAQVKKVLAELQKASASS
jgi:tetratricopeptide (TPR) repeat protein